MSSKKTRFDSFVRTMLRFKRTIALVIIVAITSMTLSTTIAMILSHKGNFTVTSFGTVKTIGVEVYWDQNRHNKIDTINWDEVWIGSSKTVTVYIRSVSNYKVTLNLKAINWEPEIISEYISLSWDYNGAELDPNEIINVTLILSVPNSQMFVDQLINGKISNFNVDINIIAS